MTAEAAVETDQAGSLCDTSKTQGREGELTPIVYCNFMYLCTVQN